MNRKEIARETLDIMEKGFYETHNTSIDIKALQEHSIKESFLLTPEQGRILLEQYDNPCPKSKTSAPSSKTVVRVWNCSTVDAILKLSRELDQDASVLVKTAPIPSPGNSSPIAVLNFASAKNPGGGFINGAMAQEESLAASSCLYSTLIAHETYYYCIALIIVNKISTSLNVLFHA